MAKLKMEFEMPANCKQCLFSALGYSIDMYGIATHICKCTGYRLPSYALFGKDAHRPIWCPLEEVEEK